jgi:hypothetical protein
MKLLSSRTGVQWLSLTSRKVERLYGRQTESERHLAPERVGEVATKTGEQFILLCLSVESLCRNAVVA